MTYEDTNCDSLANLSILDPPRWGWSAAGGITDLTPPHDRARRSKGRREYMNTQVREKKRLVREKGNSAKISTTTADKAEQAKDTVAPSSASSAPNPSVAAPTEVSAGSNAAGSMAHVPIVQNIPSIGIQIGNTIQNTSVANVSSANAAGNSNAVTHASISAENDPANIGRDTHIKVVQTPVSTIANDSAIREIPRSSTQPEIAGAVVQSQSLSQNDSAIREIPKSSTQPKIAEALVQSQSQSQNDSATRELPKSSPQPEIAGALVQSQSLSQNDSATREIPKSPTQPMIAGALVQSQSQSQNDSATRELPKSSTLFEIAEALVQSQSQSQSQSQTNKTSKQNSKKIVRTKYDFGSNYNVINKPRGRSKRDRFEIEIKTIQEDGSVHPGAYHRGIISEEPRFKGRGYLLCDTDPTDTNHGWDEPDLKLKVKIEFPLGDLDCSDDEDNNLRSVEEVKQAPRRNARRGESMKFVSETERREKREEKLAELPHFRDTVEWDLSNPKTPTPMVYAADIAAEFSLSFCRTLDLARLIQKQIDDFVKESVNYHVPISTKDHMLLPREKNSLQLPKYSNPKLLHGGHCASNVTTILKPFEMREVKKDPVASFDDAKSLTKQQGVSKPARPAVVKQVQFDYKVAKPEEIPEHDLSKLGIDPIYLNEFLRRAKEENQKVTKLLADGNIGTTKVVNNDTCHFCHIRRPELVQFACGNSAHCFCDLHTSRRLGFRVDQVTSMDYDWCPVCTLQCTCYRCHGRVEVLLPQFVKECKKQGLGPTEVKYDFVFNCSRNLAKLAKDTLKKVTTGSTASRRKNSVKAALKVNHGNIATVKVAKVPKEDFPAEMCAGINKDPSLKDDYITIFTPQGTRICEVAAKKSREEKPAVMPVTTIEDGNVDYCGECQKTGDLICCDKCPRGFHRNCLIVDPETVSGHWECPRCLQDSTAQDGEVMKGTFFHDKLLAVYKEFSETREFNAKVGILSKIFDVVKFLIAYDFGTIFSEAVDVKVVRDYKMYVKRPMDLGTITSSLLQGAYCKVSSRTKDLIEADNATEMDIIIFHVLKDIEQIWHNSFLYNREGSSFYRMGQVLRRKYFAVQKVSYESDLDPFVMKNVVLFVDECKVKRMELSNSLKPWIPANKYQISVPSRGPSKAKVVIGIFDKDTNMIVKQYTSVAGSFAVAEFLSKLGHKSEVKTENKQKFYDYIRAMQVEPSLTLFGYRWLYVEKVRSRKFTLGPNITDAIIQRQCKISKAVLEEYRTIDDAHTSWLFALSKCVGIADSQGADRSVEYFTRCYLDSDSSLDAQEWVRIKNEKGTTLENLSQSNLNTGILQHASEAVNSKDTTSHKADTSASTDPQTIEPLRAPTMSLDKSVSSNTIGAPAKEPVTLVPILNTQALSKIGLADNRITESIKNNVSGSVGTIHNEESSAVPGGGLIPPTAPTDMKVDGQRVPPEGATGAIPVLTRHPHIPKTDMMKNQDTQINQNPVLSTIPITDAVAPSTDFESIMNRTLGIETVQGDDVLPNAIQCHAVLNISAPKVEVSTNNNSTVKKMTSGTAYSNGEGASIHATQYQEGRATENMQFIPNASPPKKVVQTEAKSIALTKVQTSPPLNETIVTQKRSSKHASHVYINEASSQKYLSETINEGTRKEASGLEPKHGFSLISNNVDSESGTGSPSFRSPLAKPDIRRPSALEVETAASLLDFAMSVGSPASSIASSSKKRSANGEEVKEQKKQRHY